jgi:hypothetical protein
MRRAATSNQHEVKTSTPSPYDITYVMRKDANKGIIIIPQLEKYRVCFSVYMSSSNISNALQGTSHAGDLCIHGINWNITNISRVGPNIAVACFPAPHDSSFMKMHGNFNAWLQSRVKLPKQIGSIYSCGNKIVAVSPTITVAQHICILIDLLKDYYIGDISCLHKSSITIRQVLFSIRNMLTFPKFSTSDKCDDIYALASKIGICLRDRDGSMKAAEEYVDILNTVPPHHFFHALIILFSGGADIDGISSDELFHPSVWPEGDIVMWMTMFYHKDMIDYFKPFWLRYIFTSFGKKFPKMNLDKFTDINDLSDYIHSNVGHDINNHMKSIAYMYKMMDFILTNPTVSQKCLMTMMMKMKDFCKDIDGVTNSLIIVNPDIAKYDGFDVSIADAMTKFARSYVKGGRQMFPTEIFLGHYKPCILIEIIDARISYLASRKKELDKKRATITPPRDPSTISMPYSKDGYDEFQKFMANEAPNFERADSGCPDFIKAIYDYSSLLLSTWRFKELREFMNGIEHTIFINIKNIKKIIRHVYERKLSSREVNLATVMDIYSYFDIIRSHNETPHIQNIGVNIGIQVRDIVPVRDIVIEQEKARHTKDKWSSFSRDTPLTIMSLSNMIARQQSFEKEVSSFSTEVDCSICMMEFDKYTMFNPHGTHATMPVCYGCKTILQEKNAPCYCCRFGAAGEKMYYVKM